MITRSLFHQRPRRKLPVGQRRSPVAGPRHKGAFPTCGWARRPAAATVFGREQAERATQSNNYWSATTNAGNPNYAWSVNFNVGLVGGDFKTFGRDVRAVRSGL